MQTWITDKDFYKSAYNLDTKRLGSQTYEGIHILASLLDVNDKLVNPKRNVKNHPVSKLWVGYEYELLCYIRKHLDNWHDRNYDSIINETNYKIICMIVVKRFKTHFEVPSWITDELIQVHRSVLIQKEIEKENKLLDKYSKNKYVDLNKFCKETNKIKNDSNYHYRNLWPNCPRDKVMRYDFRSDI